MKKEITYKKISDLIPYHNNPRINEGAINHVASSIKEFNFQNPIVIDEFNVIVCGHTRLKAAIKLGLAEVPCIKADDLTPAQIKAFRIADNKTNEFSIWDFPLLGVELQELKELDFDYDFGFDEDIFAPEKDGLTDDDYIPEEAEPICQTGDLWQLGEHRLLCGDATKKEDVERLMDGKKADMVFTDPPYGVDYEGGSGNQVKREKLINDNLNIYKGFIPTLPVQKSVALYIWFAGKFAQNPFTALLDNGYEIRALLIWNKLKAHYGAYMAQYMQKHEPFIYAVRNSPKFYGATNEVTVWEYEQPHVNDLHPTQKPLEICVRAIKNSSAEGKIVYDCFLGSGSTLIACEKTNRKCFGLEIDNHYCDVIIKRWEEYTGNKAVKL